MDARSRNNTVRCSEATCDGRSWLPRHVLLFFFRETETSTILFASFPTPLSTLDRRAAVTRRTRGSVDRQLYTYKKISKNNKLTSFFVEEKNKTISLFVEQRQYDWDPAATICFSERLSDISARTCVYIIYPTPFAYFHRFRRSVLPVTRRDIGMITGSQARGRRAKWVGRMGVIHPTMEMCVDSHAHLNRYFYVRQYYL